MRDLLKAWEYTRAISVRTHLRTYQKGRGQWLNATTDTPLGSTHPDSPWAIYLSDGTLFHLVCFDFDAHEGTRAQRHQTREDATACAQLLNTAGIQTLTCRSGPTGGRHVWAATLEGLDSTLIRHIAHAARLNWPSLDPTPLLNPKTGCVRPPYSPHRISGESQPISGNPDALELPTSRTQNWERLLTLLAEQAPTGEPPTRPGGNMLLNDEATPWVPGRKRHLNPRIMRLLTRPLKPTTDASRRSWSILLAAARAHWTLTDVKTLLKHQYPGLSHLTHLKHGHTRLPRPTSGPTSMHSVLTREWEKAVTTVSRTPRTRTGNDASWVERTQHTVTLIDRIVQRINEQKWVGAQASDLRILTALCYWALQASTTSLEADIRRLALTTGLSRETARISLHRLENHEWISLEKHAEGVHAHTWKINNPSTLRTEIVSKPATSGHAPSPWATTRAYLMKTLSSWLTLISHDACTRNGLGIEKSNTRISQKLSHTAAAKTLETAVSEELHALDQIASHLHVTGVVAQRKHVYQLERNLYAWWIAELSWMRKPLPKHHRHYTLSLTTITHGHYPPMPRRHHKADWKTALHQIKQLTPTH